VYYIVAVVYALLICEQCPYDEVCGIHTYHPSLNALLIERLTYEATVMA